MELRRAETAAELDAVDDVAPLVGAAHLQDAAMAPRQLDEVVGLQDHVVELDEGQLLLALEPELDCIHGEHAVDREMPADVAQEIDVVERGEPFGIVDHQAVGAALAEADEAGEGLHDRALVGLDLLDGEDLAGLVAPRRVADPRGAAAHQRDRLAAELLQPVQHHDGDEAADMERGGGAIITDIGHHLAAAGLGVEAIRVGALVDVAALVEEAQQVGSELAHP